MIDKGKVTVSCQGFFMGQKCNYVGKPASYSYTPGSTKYYVPICAKCYGTNVLTVVSK